MLFLDFLHAVPAALKGANLDWRIVRRRLHKASIVRSFNNRLSLTEQSLCRFVVADFKRFFKRRFANGPF